MKRVGVLCFSAFLMISSAVVAQGEIEAYRLSQTDINGTARYLGMGGAFGALGGDISSMHTNPGGIGIYRSSEITGTVSLNMFKTNSNWNGSKADMNKTTFNLDNFGYVGYFPTGNREGVVGWNVGFSYNRLKNFNRKYRVNGIQEYSISDYIADITNPLEVTEKDLTYIKNSYDPYNNEKLPWLTVLGYEAGFIGLVEGENDLYGSVYGYRPENINLYVREWGGIDQYNFTFATNISNLIFVGATFGVTDINYRMETQYDEKFKKNDKLYLDNYFSTDGTGYNFNLGVIARPSDYLRLGIAYNSPVWYKMTDYFNAYAGSVAEEFVDDPEIDAETPDRNAASYKLRTPEIWLFSIAGLFGQNGLISVDYELTNFTSAKLSHETNYNLYDYENEDIRRHAQAVHTIRVGGEYKVTPRFSIRAGGSWQSSYAKDILKDNKEEVFTANAGPGLSTVPNFTVDKGTSSFSLGFGYRFTPNVYMDMAYVYRQRNENSYMFSNIYYDNGDQLVSTPASLKTKTNRIALTLGYKF